MNKKFKQSFLTVQDRRFSERILFTDECLFTNKGVFNRNNMRSWDPQNRHWIREVAGRRGWSTMVWGGIVGDRIVGPTFFHGPINGDVYLNFLINTLPQLLGDIPLNVINEMWWMQDGAPAHRTNAVVNHLNEVFPQRWIGLRGDVFWPPYSPDLTVLDFFLWGYVKKFVYDDHTPQNVEGCENLIRQAFASVTVEMLRRARRNFEMRVHLCVEVMGGRFENIIKCRRCNIFRNE